jgi:hypothetical protein
MALDEQTAPARRALAVLLPYRAFAAKGGKVGPPALFQVLPDVVQSIAAVAVLAGPRRELRGPGVRVAEALGVREGAKLSVLVLAALLLLSLPVLSGGWLCFLRLGCGPPFGSIIIDSFDGGGLVCLAGR